MPLRLMTPITMKVAAISVSSRDRQHFKTITKNNKNILFKKYINIEQK